MLRNSHGYFIYVINGIQRFVIRIFIYVINGIQRFVIRIIREIRVIRA